MDAKNYCSWKCTIGNLKRWTSGTSVSLKLDEIKIDAFLEDRNQGIVQFSWTGDFTFAEILQRAGNTPLPPYLKRNAEESDKERYQTVYSSKEGAVAAPTAGLHFTASVFDALHRKNILTDFLTLHVSAGTFQPIKVQNAWEHNMHQEQILVSRKNIENILASKNIVAVGTTSLRTLESIYWYGVKLVNNPDAPFSISQHDPYMQRELPSVKTSLEQILKYFDIHQIDNVTGETSIYIVPGYTFRVCDALITNFHQPASTLILLIAAFIGNDWKKVYDVALNHGYRFLSYGDSSLLVREK
jgi:S-adenosylmethionine:tRNA ribosyltransferase-isomerase